MSFIFGVLIIGALLSAIFGRRVAAMFVTGTATVVGILFAVLLVLLFPLIIGFLREPSHVESSSYSSYTPSYSAPSYGATPVQAAAPAPPALAASGAPAGPRIGVVLEAVPPETEQYLNAFCNVPVGVGLQFASVSPGGPADAAGLRPDDIVVSATTDGRRYTMIGPSYDLPHYLDAVGYGVPVTLHVFRLSERRAFYVAATPQ